jgi:threonine dehydrogenase-like Zn-dependent dehydrogenase
MRCRKSEIDGQEVETGSLKGRREVKAAVVYAHREIGVEEIETPRIQGESDILVKVSLCGICGGDIHYYKVGAHPEIGYAVDKGRVLGHQWVGKVAEVGSKVQNVKVGDRITCLGSFGAMAEYIKLTPETPGVLGGMVSKVPPEVSDEEAACLEQLFVGLTAMANSYPYPASGETVVVMGVGPIGLGLVQDLKALTDTKVIAIGRQSQKRLNAAKQLGADVVIRASDVDPYEKVLELTGSIPWWDYEKPAAGVDIVYDCAGHPANSPRPAACEQGLCMLRPLSGRLVLVAGFEGTVELDLMPIIYKQLKVLGSIQAPPELINQSLDLMRTKKVNAKALISHIFPLGRVKEAFETQMNTADSLLVLIKP